MKTEEILNERKKTHGDFERFSKIWLALCDTFSDLYQESDTWLSDAQVTAIHMIFLKISRMVYGDPSHADHWDDIAGYAMLGKGKEEKRLFSEPFSEPCNHDDLDIFYCSNSEDVIGKYGLCKTCYQLHVLDIKESATRPKGEEGKCEHPHVDRIYSMLANEACRVRTKCFYWKCGICDYLQAHKIIEENRVDLQAITAKQFAEAFVEKVAKEELKENILHEDCNRCGLVRGVPCQEHVKEYINKEECNHYGHVLNTIATNTNEQFDICKKCRIIL